VSGPFRTQTRNGERGESIGDTGLFSALTGPEPRSKSGCRELAFRASHHCLAGACMTEDGADLMIDMMETGADTEAQV
jgi:hypothetical protein